MIKYAHRKEVFMSKLLKAKCKKCAGYVQFDIGDMGREEAESSLKSYEYWQCTAGNHIEMMSPFFLYDFDWDNLKEHKPTTEDEFCKDIKSKFKEVYSTDELQDKYIVDSFSMGKCLCHPRNGDEDELVIFDFIHSPKGKRYYVLML